MDAKHNRLVYDHEKEDFTIREGIIIGKNQKVIGVCLKRIEEKTGKTFDDIHQDITQDYYNYKKRQSY